MQAARRRKQRPTIRSARFSLRSRCAIFMSTDIRPSRAQPDASSIRLSAPNPSREMLPAATPAQTATAASIAFQAIVRYSSLRPRWMRAARFEIVKLDTGLDLNNSSTLDDTMIFAIFGAVLDADGNCESRGFIFLRRAFCLCVPAVLIAW